MLADAVLSLLAFNLDSRSFFGRGEGTPTPLTPGFRGPVWVVSTQNVRTLLPRPTHPLVHAPNGFSWGVVGSGSHLLSVGLLHAVLPCPWVVRQCYETFSAQYVERFTVHWEIDAILIEQFLRDRSAVLVSRLLGARRIRLVHGILIRKQGEWFLQKDGVERAISFLQVARLIAQG